MTPTEPTKHEQRLAKRIAPTAFGFRSLEHKQMVVRFVALDELLPDAWGWRRELAREETLQFYELSRRDPRRGDDIHGMPHVRIPVAGLEQAILKNGRLRLSPGRRRQGPKLVAQKMSAEDVARLLAWLPQARERARFQRREAGYHCRREARESSRRRRDEIVSRWRLRAAERFRAQPQVRSRPSPLGSLEPSVGAPQRP